MTQINISSRSPASSGQYFRNSFRCNHPRRGAALIIAMVLLLLVGAISAAIVRGFYQDRNEHRQSLIKTQANLLQEDYHRRAKQQFNASPDFTGETLKLTGISDSAPGSFELVSVAGRSGHPSGETVISTEVRYYDENDRLIYSGNAKISQEANHVSKN
ncbi:MAG: hypothetical protein FWC50_16255 [Planctomycetaceae bacterium]|nr:hypothetical protein [Planctomycetaceae bacterium]